VNGRPAEGRYLDAKLAIIAQQVDERVDGIQGRRRRGLRAGVALLAAVSLGATAATAAALSYSPPATVVVEVPVTVENLRCVEGDTAYFTARYTVPADEPDPVDRDAACATARVAAAELDPEATPEQLLAIAREVLAESADGAEIRVLHATFGAVG
jgi:hypothetical protein